MSQETYDVRQEAWNIEASAAFLPKRTEQHCSTGLGQCQGKRQWRLQTKPESYGNGPHNSSDKGFSRSERVPIDPASECRQPFSSLLAAVACMHNALC